MFLLAVAPGSANADASSKERTEGRKGICGGFAQSFVTRGLQGNVHCTIPRMLKRRPRNIHIKVDFQCKLLDDSHQANVHHPHSSSGDQAGRKSPHAHLSPSDSISRPAVSLLIVTELDGLQPGVEQVGVRQHRPGAHPPQEAVGAGSAHVQQVGRSLSARGRCARREGGACRRL